MNPTPPRLVVSGIIKDSVPVLKYREVVATFMFTNVILFLRENSLPVLDITCLCNTTRLGSLITTGKILGTLFCVNTNGIDSILLDG